MEITHDATDRIERALNAEGRSTEHVLAGLALCIGAVALSGFLSARRVANPAGPQPAAKTAMKALWPAVFSLTTLAAVRVWNAPPGPARNRALRLWGVLQGVNALWMAIGPRGGPARVAAAATTAGLTAAYAQAAAKADPAGAIGTPSLAAIAGLFSRNSPRATLH